MTAKIRGMDTFEAGTGIGQYSILEIRVELIGSEPAIRRQFELRGSLALSQVHQVLQAAFGWEDAHVQRFVTSDPFAPLPRVDGEFPKVRQWLPQQSAKNRATGLRRSAPWMSCLHRFQAERSTNTTLVTAAFTGSSRFPVGPRSKTGLRPG